MSPNGPLRATPSPLGEIFILYLFSKYYGFFKIIKKKIYYIITSILVQKNVIFKSFHEVKKNSI
jgi:hypothetical protein